MTSPQPQAKDEVERLVEMLKTGAWSGGAPTPLELEAASTLTAQARELEVMRGALRNIEGSSFPSMPAEAVAIWAKTTARAALNSGGAE